MKRCTICQTPYPDDANFCPNDGGRLDVVQEAAASPGTATSSPNVVGGRFALGLAAGGSRTGQVFAARDATNGQECAVKFVAVAVVPTPIIAQRVERELKQLQKVASDHVVRVIESGKQGEQYWVAMEAAPGRALDKVVAASGPLAPARALKLALAIGDGLAEAAKQGVIHRDVAPKNVLWFDGDRVKVTNFALPIPLNERISGVPAFMSPEQAEGKAVDQRSNIYSLGALLYYMLTGEPPFGGAPGSILQQVIEAAPMPPTLKPAGTNVPPAVEKLILRALEKSSSKRHMTLRQMLSEIETLIAGGTPAVDSGPGAARTMIGGFGNFPLPPEVKPGAPANGAAMAGGADLATVRGNVVGPPSAMQPPPAQPEGFGATMMAPAPQVPAPMPPARAVGTPASVVPTPFQPAPQAPVMPAAPMAPQAPVQAAAPSGDGGAGGKGKAAAVPPPAQAQKGKFRETMWFKKGELDEAAAQAAASAPQSPDALPVSDKADELPIEDRYKDDGSISAKDREKFSLRTGATAMMPAVNLPPEPVAGAKMDERDMVSEMKGGRGKTVAIVLAAVLVIGGFLAWQLLGGKKHEPPATTPTTEPAPK